MFPEYDDLMGTFLESLEVADGEALQGKSVPKFDFETNRFVMANGRTVYCSPQEALTQWIELCIRTKANVYRCYDETTFGNASVHLLYGNKETPRSFLESNMAAELTERLEAHVMIERVDGFEITRESGVMKIVFVVTTVLGIIEKGVVIYV